MIVTSPSVTKATRILAVALAVCLTTPALAGEQTANDVIARFHKGDVRVLYYIQGLGHAYQYGNVALEDKGQPRLFCAPERIALTVEQEVDIMERYIQRYPSSATTMLQGVMFFALRDAFPCK